MLKSKRSFFYKLAIAVTVLAGVFSLAAAAKGRIIRHDSGERPEDKKEQENYDSGKEQNQDWNQDEEENRDQEIRSSADAEPDEENSESDENNDAEESQSGSASESETTDAGDYPVHQNVSTTYFWIGEGADEDNGHISNSPSAWDEAWVKHYGGTDDPKKRDGYFPAKFTPKENPFYFALPYNDFNENGDRKKDAFKLADWADSKDFSSDESICKNQWIKITKGGKTAYAQWEDVGPFGEDDSDYVFGNSAPDSNRNEHAGLDVSPAVKDYLGLSDVDKTDWQFVSAEDVPDGPWKKIVTKSQTYWK